MSRFTDLQLCHQGLQSVQKFTCGIMCDKLLIQTLLENGEKTIEFLGFNNWPVTLGSVKNMQFPDNFKLPWYNIQTSPMEPRDKVRILFFLDYFPEF